MAIKLTLTNALKIRDNNYLLSETSKQPQDKYDGVVHSREELDQHIAHLQAIKEERLLSKQIKEMEKREAELVSYPIELINSDLIELTQLDVKTFLLIDKTKVIPEPRYYKSFKAAQNRAKKSIKSKFLAAIKHYREELELFGEDELMRQEIISMMNIYKQTIGEQ